MVLAITIHIEGEIVDHHGMGVLIHPKRVGSTIITIVVPLEGITCLFPNPFQLQFHPIQMFQLQPEQDLYLHNIMHLGNLLDMEIME
jgi:hypothetical protein